MDNKKVMVGCLAPKINEFCIKTYKEKLAHSASETLFVTDNTKIEEQLKNFGKTVLIENNFDSQIKWRVAARNRIREEFLKSKCTNLLISDVSVIPDTNMIKQLATHDKDIVTGIYLTSMVFDKEVEIIPAIFGFAQNGARLMQTSEVIGNALTKISCGGLGCCLISKKVLTDIKFRFYKNTNTGDDISFYRDAAEKGFESFADTSVKCNVCLNKDKKNLAKFFDFDAHPPIRNPKVLIGCVTHDKDEAYLQGFLEAVRDQDYENTDILLVDSSKEDEFSAKLKGTGVIVRRAGQDEEHYIKKIVAGRKEIRKYALDNNYDYVLFVDTDVRPPKHALSKLLSDRKDVVAAVCLINSNIKGVSRIMPNTYDFDDEEGYCRPMMLNDALNNEIKEVSCAGFGCTLVSSKVLKNVDLRFYEKSMAGEDIAFFVDSREKGFKTFADNSVKCSHLVFPPGDPRNRKFMFETYEKGESYSLNVSNMD